MENPFRWIAAATIAAVAAISSVAACAEPSAEKSLDSRIAGILDSLRPRLKAEPAKTWYSQVRGTASVAPNELPETGFAWKAARNAEIAKCAAFEFALTGDLSAKAAWLDALGTIDGIDPSKVKGNELLAIDSAASDAAISLLLGRLDAGDSDREAAAGIVGNLGGILMRNRPAWFEGAKNNWGVRQYSALLTCALVLESEPGFQNQAADWIAYCDSELPLHCEFQSLSGKEIPDISGWAEGHSYLEYSLDLWLDCMFIDRLARPERATEIESRLAALSRWSVMSAAPDGRRPNFDDSALAGFPSNVAASIVSESNPALAEVLTWDYMRQQDPENPKDHDPVLSLLTYRPELFANSGSPIDVDTKGAFPLGWLDTGTGDMVMRTGWGDLESYVNVRIESGDAHWHGIGHEHWDPLALSFYSGTREGGKWILLDGGYINWEEHSRVNTPDNHNMLLVDGLGPDWTKPVPGGEVREAAIEQRVFDTPGFTGAWLDEEGNVHYAEPVGFYGTATTTYRGVSWRRELMLLRDGMLFVRDTVTSDEPGKSKRLAFPWHLNFPADMPLEEAYRSTKLGGKYECMFFGLPGGEAGSIEFYSNSPFSLSFRTDEHSFEYGIALSHHVVEAAFPAEEFAKSNTFTLYTLVSSSVGLGFLDRYDPPESIPDVIADIWNQVE